MRATSLSFSSSVSRAPVARASVRPRAAASRAPVPVTAQWVLKSARGQNKMVLLSEDDEFSVTLGRQSDFEGSADIALGYKTISTRHVKIERKKDKATITDLNSTNGTWVNRQDLARVRGRTMALKPGDAVEIGGEMFRYMEVEEEVASKASMDEPEVEEAPRKAAKGLTPMGTGAPRTKSAPGGKLMPQKPTESR